MIALLIAAVVFLAAPTRVNGHPPADTAAPVEIRTTAGPAACRPG
jgi:hypothetical protein